MQAGIRSTNTACWAPRLRASIPKLPDPAKRSSTRAPAICGPSIEKSDSLTRSAVGRVPVPFTVCSRSPPALPAITRMASPPPFSLPDPKIASALILFAEGGRYPSEQVDVAPEVNEAQVRRPGLTQPGKLARAA